MKNKNNSFQRALPCSTSFLEKPMAQWASGKIKRLYDGYDSFCQEIGRLLGEPDSKLQVSTNEKPEMLEEFESLWIAGSPQENTDQLLTVLSSFYKAGFIVKSLPDRCQILSYFLENVKDPQLPEMGREYERFTPLIETEQDALTTSRLTAHSVMTTLGLKNLGWIEKAEAFHFWLYPEENTSVVLVSDLPEPRKKEVVLKTQALIQRRFYG